MIRIESEYMLSCPLTICRCYFVLTCNVTGAIETMATLCISISIYLIYCFDKTKQEPPCEKLDKLHKTAFLLIQFLLAKFE